MTYIKSFILTLMFVGGMFGVVKLIVMYQQTAWVIAFLFMWAIIQCVIGNEVKRPTSRLQKHLDHTAV